MRKYFTAEINYSYLNITIKNYIIRGMFIHMTYLYKNRVRKTVVL
jgi:hypothetical protein